MRSLATAAQGNARSTDGRRIVANDPNKETGLFILISILSETSERLSTEK